ncbi:3876_t:CDS:1, partial [Racocetra fulgida]
KYFPELSALLNFLVHYSLCKRHYNQIVTKSFFINQLKANNLVFLGLEETVTKRLRLSDDLKNDVSDFGVQVYFLDLACKSLLKRIEELENFNRQLVYENGVLKERLKERFIDQQDCIESIIAIVKKE